MEEPPIFRTVKRQTEELFYQVPGTTYNIFMCTYAYVFVCRRNRAAGGFQIRDSGCILHDAWHDIMMHMQDHPTASMLNKKNAASQIFYKRSLRRPTWSQGGVLQKSRVLGATVKKVRVSSYRWWVNVRTQLYDMFIDKLAAVLQHPAVGIRSLLSYQQPSSEPMLTSK